MKKIYKNSLYMLAAGSLIASCADYNVTDDFKADPDPSVSPAYTDLNSVNSYIDRNSNPNMKIGVSLDVKEFNKQELAHAAAMTNFDNVSFGTSLMSGTIVNGEGVMNFIQMNDLLEHMDEVGGEIFGSPIVANANQADAWLKTLTAPIEIMVESEDLINVDFTQQPTGKWVDATVEKYEGQNALKVTGGSSTAPATTILNGFDVDPKATYTITFKAKTAKEAPYDVWFSGKHIDGTYSKDGKWAVKPGNWTTVKIENCTAADSVTEGSFSIKPTRGNTIYIDNIKVVYTPDNHRPQTVQEKTDTIFYALDTWCDGLMKINKGRIKSFDLIDEAICDTSVLENGMYDLKHSTQSTFWQDILGSENYAPTVAKKSREAFAKYEGNPDELQFFISESGLTDAKKMESLNYWIGVWDNNGAKIDGITAKMNLSYYENPDKQAANVAAYEQMLSNLAATGKLIRLTNFDIKYVDADGVAVKTTDITEQQRANLAAFNAYAIKAYMSKIAKDKQAGIVKSELVDTDAAPVGLWTKDTGKTKDWMRNATYKAWCDALSGK